MGSAHAVNLTDGLDGLAGHTAAVAYVAYGIIASLQGQIYLVTFCFTVAGALLAFLWFNAYPAEVFMGDAGALALGATLAVVALMLGQVLLLPIVGFVFVAVTVSVMLQVGYFKLTGGKRLFRMAPLHNHFEMMGWSQMQVAQRFWLVSMVTGLLGVALALGVVGTRKAPRCCYRKPSGPPVRRQPPGRRACPRRTSAAVCLASTDHKSGALTPASARASGNTRRVSSTIADADDYLYGLDRGDRSRSAARVLRRLAHSTDGGSPPCYPARQRPRGAGARW